jgi:hypothetical protein
MSFKAKTLGYSSIVLAGLVIGQAAIKKAGIPYKPILGDGNYEVIAAMTYFWASCFIAAVLVAFGCYLILRRRR